MLQMRQRGKEREDTAMVKSRKATGAWMALMHVLQVDRLMRCDHGPRADACACALC